MPQASAILGTTSRVDGISSTNIRTLVAAATNVRGLHLKAMNICAYNGNGGFDLLVYVGTLPTVKLLCELVLPNGGSAAPFVSQHYILPYPILIPAGDLKWDLTSSAGVASICLSYDIL